MNNTASIEKLEKCIEKGYLCAVNREIIDTFSLYGYPVRSKGELAVMLFVYDFMPDGFKIIRKRDITEVYGGKEERFLDKVVKSEHPELEIIAPSLKIDSMRALCEDLMQKSQIVTVECEDFEENIILIGQIVNVNKNVVTMKTFDGLGVWDDEMASVELEDITCVSIGNSYVNIISKYLIERK